MLASYLLSRTLVPILIDVLVKKEFDQRFGEHGERQPASRRQTPKSRRGKPGLLRRASTPVSSARFDALPHRLSRPAACRDRPPDRDLWRGRRACWRSAAVLFTFVGQDYFPQIDAGELTLHMRTRPGHADRDRRAALRRGRGHDPPGHPSQGSRTDPRQYRPARQQLQFRLRRRLLRRLQRRPDPDLAEGRPRADRRLHAGRCARCCRRNFRTRSSTSSRPTSSPRSWISARITPIDVQVTGRNAAQGSRGRQAHRGAAAQRARRGRRPYPADHRRAGILRRCRPPDGRRDRPDRAADRQRAERLAGRQLPGHAEFLGRPQDRHPLPALGPDAGIPQRFADRCRQHPAVRLDARSAGTTATSTTTTGSTAPQPGVVTLFNNVAKLRRQSEQTVVNHVNTQPKYDIFASVQDRDLGSVSRDIDTIVQDEQKKLAGARQDLGARPDRDMHSAFQNIEHRPRDRDDRGLPADGGQLPELGRPVRGDRGAAAGVLRHRDEPVRHPDDVLDPLAVRRDHERRRRQRQLDPAGDLRARASRGDRLQRRRGRDQGRRDPAAAGADDRRRRCSSA